MMRSYNPISIHAPAWGATLYLKDIVDSVEISIHAPAWGATSAATSVYTDISDFNPRSRVGSDPTKLRGG